MRIMPTNFPREIVRDCEFLTRPGMPCNRSLSRQDVTVRSLYNMSPFGYYFDMQE